MCRSGEVSALWFEREGSLDLLFSEGAQDLLFLLQLRNFQGFLPVLKMQPGEIGVMGETLRWRKSTMPCRTVSFPLIAPSKALKLHWYQMIVRGETPSKY